jgi:hypothetical protein
MKEYQAATWFPAIGPSGDSHWFSGRPEGPPQWIVLHGTAGGGSALDVARYFRTGPHSTHYVIGQDGTVVQCVSETDSAWGNAPAETGCDPWWLKTQNPNFRTISIEHCKAHTDNSDQLTPAQQQASFSLIRYLCEKWKIPMRLADANGGITGHNKICPIDRPNCPGPYPWDQLLAALNPQPVTPLPDGWHDANGVLTAPNGIPVVRGFRQTLLNGTYWTLGLPTEPEFRSSNIHMNTTHLPGSLQPFQFGWLIWNKAVNSIYRLQVGDVVRDLVHGKLSQQDIALITQGWS